MALRNVNAGHWRAQARQVLAAAWLMVLLGLCGMAHAQTASVDTTVARFRAHFPMAPTILVSTQAGDEAQQRVRAMLSDPARFDRQLHTSEARKHPFAVRVGGHTSTPVCFIRWFDEDVEGFSAKDTLAHELYHCVHQKEWAASISIEELLADVHAAWLQASSREEAHTIWKRVAALRSIRSTDVAYRIAQVDWFPQDIPGENWPEFFQAQSERLCRMLQACE